jgi:predicted transcriptional regulator
MKKSRIEQVVSSLPETVDVDALIERLHLLDKIEQAEAQLALGEGVPHEEAKQRLSQWLK